MDHLAMRRCIERKREGAELSPADWEGIVEAFMDGSVDEAQMAALCMACLWRGMSFEEAFALTRAMVESGATISFDPSAGTVADKHSSGGVSDIVSLVAVPLAAACGAHVAKLSGRALGHTGGTIDKLETIPGFDAALSVERFVAQVQSVGCAIAAQTESIVPADKRIYKLRDRTGTVPSMGLIAASIVSKKIAGGAHAFVFDVKTGAGAMMQNLEDARELARWLVEISKRFGRRAAAFITDMNQPLGRSIGTGIEVLEAREFLLGKGDERANEIVVTLTSRLLEECGIPAARERIAAALSNGSAYAKFLEMIVAQSGDAAAFERMQTGEPVAITAPHDGFVSRIDVVHLGNAGRRLSQHDPLGGLRVAARIGDRIETGAPLLYAYGRDSAHAANLAAAFHMTQSPVEPPPLIYATIES